MHAYLSAAAPCSATDQYPASQDYLRASSSEMQAITISAQTDNAISSMLQFAGPPGTAPSHAADRNPASRNCKQVGCIMRELHITLGKHMTGKPNAWQASWPAMQNAELQLGTPVSGSANTLKELQPSAAVRKMTGHRTKPRHRPQPCQTGTMQIEIITHNIRA